MSTKITPENSELQMREWDFKKDHENVIKLLNTVFEKELESKGLNVKTIFDEYKSMRPFLNFLGIFSKNYRHGFDGFVFENEGGEKQGD